MDNFVIGLIIGAFGGAFITLLVLGICAAAGGDDDDN